MSLISSHSLNYYSSKIQATYRGYYERKKLKFTKLLNQWVHSGPHNERIDRTRTSELIKSVYQKKEFSILRNSFFRSSHLNIYSKNISTLPNVFDHLSHLNEVHITDTNIQRLPDSLFKLSNLTMLGLAQNKLTHLPKKIEHLKNLGFLCLEDNMLTTLPEKELINLPKLRDLRCSKNIILDIDGHLLEKYSAINFRENLGDFFYLKKKYNFNIIPKISLGKLIKANNYIRSNYNSIGIINYLGRRVLGLPNEDITILHMLIRRELERK